MTKITAIIITFNEELHIKRCISSIENQVDKIIVVDSGSTDATKEIVESMGVTFYYRHWEGFSNQINWVINKAEIFSDWIIRIDADEVLEKNSVSLRSYLNNINKNVNGINIKRNIYFNKSLVKYGGIYNKKILRIFRAGFGKCDDRLMDEHIIAKPKIIDSNIVISDISLIDFKDYIIKHLNYAQLEINSEKEFALIKENKFVYSKQVNFLKLLKKNLFNKFPSRLKPFLYFFYRMIIKGGIFDEPDGFYFHLFQGLVYRSFVEYLRYKKSIQKK